MSRRQRFENNGEVLVPLLTKRPRVRMSIFQFAESRKNPDDNTSCEATKLIKDLKQISIDLSKNLKELGKAMSEAQSEENNSPKP